MKPRLVQSVLASDRTVVEEYPPEEVGRVISASAARQMRHALATVTDPKGKGNTGKRAAQCRHEDFFHSVLPLSSANHPRGSSGVSPCLTSI